MPACKPHKQPILINHLSITLLLLNSSLHWNIIFQWYWSSSQPPWNDTNRFHQDKPGVLTAPFSVGFICFLGCAVWHAACGILVPWPGIKTLPPAVETENPNHWTTREVPVIHFLDEDSRRYQVLEAYKFYCETLRTSVPGCCDKWLHNWEA